MCMIQYSDFISIAGADKEIEVSQKDVLVHVAGNVGKMTSKWTLCCTECSNYIESSTYLEADVSVNTQQYCSSS